MIFLYMKIDFSLINNNHAVFHVSLSSIRSKVLQDLSSVRHATKLINSDIQ